MHLDRKVKMSGGLAALTGPWSRLGTFLSYLTIVGYCLTVLALQTVVAMYIVTMVPGTWSE